MVWWMLFSAVVTAPQSAFVQDVTTPDGQESLRDPLTSAILDGLRSGATDLSLTSAGEVRSLMRNEAEARALGCSDASCLAEIAGALGAEIVIAGKLRELGDTWVLELRWIDARSATLVRSARDEVPTDPARAVNAAFELAQRLSDPETDAVSYDSSASWNISGYAGAAANASDVGAGVALDAHVGVVYNEWLEVTGGVSAPRAYPLTVRFRLPDAPIMLGVLGRVTPYQISDSGPSDGELDFAVGAGATLGWSTQVSGSRIGIQLDVLFSQALDLGSATYPAGLTLFWWL
ncbi:MAG: hypothetical protein AAFQ82_09915 [Myxococcota bacterium]